MVGKTTFERGLDQGRNEGRVEGRVEGRNEGRVEGRAEGRVEEQLRLLNRLLQKRFGELDLTVRDRIEKMSFEQREQLAENLLDAKSLEELGLV